MANVLVTGGAGFIGGHLVDALMEHNVVVLDNLSTGTYKVDSPNVVYYALDITKQSSDDLLAMMLKYKIEFVFHLAAQINLRQSFVDPLFDAETNVLSTLKLALAAKQAGVKKVIFASTGGAIYSEKDFTPWTESCLADPLSPYGLSKLCAEKYLQQLCPTTHTILRFSNVYGPRQNPHGEAGVIAIFLSNMLKTLPCKIFGDGTQVRDYIYVDDVVKACIAGIKLNGVYNVSTGIGTDLNTLTLMLMSQSGIPTIIQREEARPGEMKASILSSSRLQMFGEWKAETTLNVGLQKTIDWFKAQA